ALDLRSLLGAFVGGVVTALAHPYALPLGLAFALGAIAETPVLRSRQGVAAAAVVVTGSLVVYALLVPGASRGVAGEPLAGFLTSYRTSEVNVAGSVVATLLATWTASRAWPAAPTVTALVTLILAGASMAA